MTIILFLIDTSASMCQKAHVNGVQKTYLDIAKGAVETFLKFRQRSQDCMGDRYMLLTFEDPPANVKAGWKENHATFMNELKNLQSNGLTSMGEALKNAFDLLNLNRMQSGIDTYGQGRLVKSCCEFGDLEFRLFLDWPSTCWIVQVLCSRDFSQELDLL